MPGKGSLARHLIESYLQVWLNINWLINKLFQLGGLQGSSIDFLSDIVVFECKFVQQSMYVILLKPRQKGCNFQFKMHNIQYSLDNESNIYWTKCLYHLLKIQMSNLSE